MRFDMHIRAKLAALRQSLRQNHLHGLDNPLDIVRLVRRNRFDGIRKRHGLTGNFAIMSTVRTPQTWSCWIAEIC